MSTAKVNTLTDLLDSYQVTIEEIQLAIEQGDTTLQQLNDHEADVDPHTQYYNETRGDARYALLSTIAQPDGIASLNSSGQVPSNQLPSYVDDVLEYADLASFPTTGETGKIYVALDTNKAYRWGGSTYVYITSGAVDSVNGYTGVITLTTDDIGEGGTNLYYTDARASDAAPIQSIFGRTGDVIATAGDYDAVKITFSNTTSGLTATDVQAALDEIDQNLDDHEAAIDPHPQYTTTSEASAAAPVQSVDSQTGNVVLTYIDDLTFNSASGDLTGNVPNGTNQVANLDGRYLIDNNFETRLGEYGLGVLAPQLLTDIDDTNILAGEYKVDDTTIGTFPSGISAQFGTLKVIRYAAAQFSQEYTRNNVSDNKRFFRIWNGSFSPWREYYHTGNFDPTQFLRSDANDTGTGDYTFSGRVILSNYNGGLRFDAFNNDTDWFIHGPDGPGDNILHIIRNATNNYDIEIVNQRILTVADEGSGNGLDADTVDGVHGTSLVRKDIATQTIDSGAADANLNVKSDDGFTATISAYGDSQGTGVLYAGQDSGHGGGIFYNGDGTPSYATGEASDRISLFRRDDGTNHVVADWSYNSNVVDFKDTPTVNSNPLSGKVFETSNTASADNNKYTKIATVTLNAQFNDYNAILFLHTSDESNGEIHARQLHIGVKQQAAFGNDPLVYCEMLSYRIEDRIDVGYVIEQNTGPTIVTFYLKSSSTFTQMHGWLVAESVNTSIDTVYFSVQPFEGTDPTGIVAVTTKRIWSESIHGAGSGLDADLLDAQEGSYYLDYNNFTNTPTFDNYGGWDLQVDGISQGNIDSAESVNFVGGTNVNLGYSATNNTITIDSTASGGGGGITWSIVSVNTNAAPDNGYLVDCSGGPITITLPASPSEGDTIGISDFTKNSETNNITLARNGNNIVGLAEDLIININGAGFDLVYTDASVGWEIVSEINTNVDIPNVVQNTSVSGVVEKDPNLGRYIIVTMTGDTTLSLTSISEIDNAYRVTVEVKQDATGGHNLTFGGTNILFPGGTQPVNSTAANAVDIIELVWNGTNYILSNYVGDVK
ncbi:MAG: pyocin knob domain-containing protein [Nitrosopumilaceae archaeon]|nr:pyocin knob domain-containing protein [Nitrosopumilaceae archaeon]